MLKATKPHPRPPTRIPEPDWDEVPWPEPYEPPKSRRPNPIPLPKEHAAIKAALACGHVGRLPDTTPDDLTARIEAERDGLIKAIRLPWWNLNKHISFGLYPGNVTIVAGPPGTSKSYFALNVLLAAGKAGCNWRLLPLEDNAETWALKALAVNIDSWDLISQPETEDDRYALGERKLAHMDKHGDFIADMFQCIAENPRVPVKGMDGSLVRRQMLEGEEDYPVGECLPGVVWMGGGRQWRRMRRRIS